MTTTTPHRLVPVDDRSVSIEYGGPCDDGSATWTSLSNETYELPKGVQFSGTSWDVCFNTRGWTTDVHDIRLFEGEQLPGYVGTTRRFGSGGPGPPGTMMRSQAGSTDHAEERGSTLIEAHGRPSRSWPIAVVYVFSALSSLTLMNSRNQGPYERRGRLRVPGWNSCASPIRRHFRMHGIPDDQR